MAVREPLILGVDERHERIVDLSVVLPVYNEEENLTPLHDELDAELKKLDLTYQIVYVNDGSKDSSPDILARIAQDNPETVTFVDLRRNFGQTAATAAGIDYAVGEVVIFMDADLQNDPRDIETVYNKLNDEGWDVVSGWRKDRKDKFLTRKLPSMVANQLISTVTGVHLHDYGCTLKAYRKEVLDEIALYGEMHRFIPVFAVAAGASITEMVVNHRPRLYGRSKYGLERTVKVILDLVTVKFLLSYRTTPMYLFGGVGIFFLLTSFVALGYAILRALINNASLINTPLPTLSATLFAVGIYSVLLGLVAEMLVRTYHEAQEKPVYVVRRIMEQDYEMIKPRKRVG